MGEDRARRRKRAARATSPDPAIQPDSEVKPSAETGSAVDTDPAAGTDSDLDVDPELDAAIRALAPAERMRERNIWVWLSLGGVLVLVLFLLVFWPVMRGRLDATKQLEQAVVLLGQAEGTTAAVDKTVAVQLSADALSSAPDVAAEILVARRELGQANQLIDDAMPHLADDEQQRATLVKTAVRARLTMLDSAPAILIASVKAVQAKTLGDRAWQLTLHAQTAETAAVRDYEGQTASTVESASVAVTTIQIELSDARDLYSQAASAFPDAGFEQYAKYVDVRRAAVAQLAQATTQWLHNGKPLAKATFANYQSSATKVSSAAKSLPYAPGSATGAGFRKVAGSQATAYAKAEKQAEAADKALKAP